MFAGLKRGESSLEGGEEIGGADRLMEFACNDVDLLVSKRMIKFRFLWDIISVKMSIRISHA